MNDHICYILGYILLIFGYDVNGLPMNHHDFDFFQSVHNFMCFACDKKIPNIQHRLFHRSKLRTFFNDTQAYFLPFHLLNLEV